MNLNIFASKKNVADYNDHVFITNGGRGVEFITPEEAEVATLNFPKSEFEASVRRNSFQSA